MTYLIRFESSLFRLEFILPNIVIGTGVCQVWKRLSQFQMDGDKNGITSLGCI